MEEKAIVTTERLLIRLWNKNDIDDFYKIMSDPMVTRFTRKGPWTYENTKAMVIGNINHTNIKTGIYNLPLVRRSDKKILGRVGLNRYLVAENIPEIQWTLGREYWNSGYATEIGKAMIEYGFNVTGFNEIVGFTDPDNIGSKKVMEKIGMTFVEEKEHLGYIYVFYSIRK